jgi:hypothetical protein
LQVAAKAARKAAAKKAKFEAADLNQHALGAEQEAAKDEN